MCQQHRNSLGTEYAFDYDEHFSVDVFAPSRAFPDIAHCHSRETVFETPDIPGIDPHICCQHVIELVMLVYLCAYCIRTQC